jgi:hypothetical protein
MSGISCEEENVKIEEYRERSFTPIIRISDEKEKDGINRSQKIV